MWLVVFFLSLAPVVSHARCDLQCMARFRGQWRAVTVPPVEVTATHCSPTIEFPDMDAEFRLESGPEVTGDRITCQWAWSSVYGRLGGPGDGVPESVICVSFPNL